MHMNTIAPGRDLDLSLEELDTIEAPDDDDFLLGVAVGLMIGGLLLAT